VSVAGLVGRAQRNAKSVLTVIGWDSDYDIAISGDSVNQAAHENGVQFHGDGVSTGPLSERDARLPVDKLPAGCDATAG
jgi:hypothetical protein